MKHSKSDKTRVISLDDLAPRADVKGGAGVRVFGQASEPGHEHAASGGATRPAVKKTAIKDLSSSPKSGTVKGGGRGQPVSA